MVQLKDGKGADGWHVVCGQVAGRGVDTRVCPDNRICWILSEN